MDKDPDQTLVEGCRNGDRAAFGALVARYQRPIYNAAYRVLGNADDAADTAQAVFLKVAEKLDDYDPQYKFFSWLYRIAVNESLNLLRRNKREDPLDEEVELPGAESANPEWQLNEAQLSRRVQGALMRLKADDRVVITLRHFSECSYREIGVILELDERTVKSRLFEARSRLKGMLKDLQDH
ncbi:MAG: sigma-70 family RNA polymerase sigma factor [Betaproteobacteria bacterium]|nr:sigma-70 family RNA polymerase sigma factor [Betaproteobacteria bacterium]